VSGNFQVDDTGVGGFYWNQGGGVNTTLSIGGNLIFNGGLVGFIGQTGSNGTLNISGDLVLTGGYFQIVEDVDGQVNVQGNVNISGSAIFDFSGVSAFADLNVYGNFTYTGGDILVSSFPSGGVGNLNFVGSSGVQTYTSSLVPLGEMNYYVSSLSVLRIPSGSFIAGGGTFTLDGTLEVGSTNSSGAMQTGFTAGNMRVTGVRTYNSSSTIVYAGSAAQFIGDGHPTSSGVNTTINNASGVSLIVGVPIIITTNLTLTSGNLNIGNGALTLNGNLSAGSNNISIGSGGSITISGSGSIGTFPFPSGAQSFTNFTLDNTNGVTFANATTITGLVTLTNGSLSFGGTTLILSGTFSPSGSGDLSPSNTSTLIINGSGAFGTPRINATNNTVGTFTFSRSVSGTATLVSTLNVANNFNLTNGTLTNSGLVMADGSTLTRNSNGALIGSPSIDIGQTYNVTYTGSTMTTGLELPTTASDMLRTLTINGGIVTLDKNIIVNGNVNLLSSTFDANGFNITMQANPGTWNKTTGTFIGGSGALIIAGNISITASSTPNFSNITANSGSTLTLPSGDMNIAGNLQLNAAGTFSNNNGTITLNGSGAQTIAGAGKNFNNITVNKGGGSVSITPSVNLIGILNIVSATTVQANGNLTLISTSDGASGNASIAKIPAGASVTGNVIVQRRMSGEGRIYRDISSPVQSATVQQIMNSGITVTGFSGSSFPCAGCATNGASMYSYNEAVTGPISNGYTAITAASQTLTTGKGYNVLVRNEVGPATMLLTGTINSGTIDFNSPSIISYTSTPDAGDGWNFVGNPYPASIDWDNGWTKGNIQGNMISIWDAGANQYKTWNGAVGTLGTGRIAQGQGFWFQASAAPTLSVTEDSKISATGAFYRKKETEIHYVELIIAGAGLEDRTYIQQVEGALLGFDAQDGTKLAWDGFNISSLTKDEKKRSLAINAVDRIITSGEIELSINNIVDGEYSVSMNSVGGFAGVKVSIRDNVTGITTDLSNGTKYSFSVTKNLQTKAVDRFVLVFGEAESDQRVVLFPNPIVDSRVAVRAISNAEPRGIVMDNMGKFVGTINWKQEVAGSKYWNGSMDMTSHTPGMYLVRVETIEGVDVIKFINK
jgi:hypothetical protein